MSARYSFVTPDSPSRASGLPVLVTFMFDTLITQLIGVGFVPFFFFFNASEEPPAASQAFSKAQFNLNLN